MADESSNNTAAVAGMKTAPDAGFSRSRRIADSAIFREAFANGLRRFGKLMVFFRRSGEGASMRLGVVTSKKSLRRACDRARARRLMREAFRLNRHRFHGQYDIILVARSAIRGRKRQDVEKELLGLAREAGVTD